MTLDIDDGFPDLGNEIRTRPDWGTPRRKRYDTFQTYRAGADRFPAAS